MSDDAIGQQKAVIRLNIYASEGVNNFNQKIVLIVALHLQRYGVQRTEGWVGSKPPP